RIDPERFRMEHGLQHGEGHDPIAVLSHRDLGLLRNRQRPAMRRKEGGELRPFVGGENPRGHHRAASTMAAGGRMPAEMDTTLAIVVMAFSAGFAVATVFGMLRAPT